MRIFWSWQSDHPANISRHFVRGALEIAVAALKQELAIEEPERDVSLDHDRKGVPGSPDLANVILEKIRGTDVFVADVTPVGATSSDPPKKLINSNVAIELGYALHTITDRRLIMVMNAAYGTRGDLPFDLQHKAGPLSYTLAADANKRDIDVVRTQLAGQLKVALREILPTLAPQNTSASFQQVAPDPANPARYFPAHHTLITRRDSFGGGPRPFTVPDTPTLYLRIIPTRPTSPLKRTEAENLVRGAPDYLEPFYYDRRGASFESNQFGAIAFDTDNKDQILCAAQLFLNREIWAFNTISLSPELAKALGKTVGVPTLAVERTFALFLPAYARFLNTKLGVPPPYRIEAGAYGIKDYVIHMPNNYFGDTWGPIHDNHVHWSGILKTLDAKDVDAVLLNIFEAFFDAGACARPPKLYGFPADQPGTPPKG